MDCSDGMARCVDGVVERSLLAHVAYPCAPKPGAAAPGGAADPERAGDCACPWSAVGRCAGATRCVQEGLEVVAAADVAREQLCTAAEAVIRPVLPAEAAVVTICADESVSCVDGVVRSCGARGQPARLLGACLSGCASGVALEPDDLRTGDGPAAILCRRLHAERR